MNVFNRNSTIERKGGRSHSKQPFATSFRRANAVYRSNEPCYNNSSTFSPNFHPRSTFLPSSRTISRVVPLNGPSPIAFLTEPPPFQPYQTAPQRRKRHSVTPKTPTVEGRSMFPKVRPAKLPQPQSLPFLQTKPKRGHAKVKRDNGTASTPAIQTMDVMAGRNGPMVNIRSKSVEPRALKIARTPPAARPRTNRSKMRPAAPPNPTALPKHVGRLATGRVVQRDAVMNAVIQAGMDDLESVVVLVDDLPPSRVGYDPPRLQDTPTMQPMW
ncbi:hypothetical protein J8273_1316 [Carpediemonas membranifera]|uniref:Uncharacterized protein n=1 Tax=Carpediemonas membranifera TaxID=201153 RepID=A0A8J6E4A6_9EUKA|nr:hypothetical protein J8273_1316 [Carpediemonas membranifera]|eukprot:KAG9396968.1 hypothetical protein J8273_1316 [Carpediemonas membranifera]